MKTGCEVAQAGSEKKSSMEMSISGDNNCAEVAADCECEKKLDICSRGRLL
jgi:hypothetical protein